MSEFRLFVHIDEEDLKTLVQQGFNFCLGRDVEFDGTVRPGNVVFAGVRTNLLAANLGLQWEDNFQIFGAKEFHNGIIISIVTKPAAIEGGQQATIDEKGDIQVTGNPQPGKPFTAVNDWQPMANIGVGALVDGARAYSTFFVSPSLQMTAMAEFLPLGKYFVFWDKNLVAGTMFDCPGTPSFPIEFTSNNRITIRYAKGTWSVVD